MLNYLFFRFFKFFDFIEKHFTPEGMRIPEYLAMFAIAFLVIFNLITLDIFVNNYFGIRLVLISLPVTLFFVLIVFIILYISFFRKKKYLSIIEKYNNESTIAMRLSTVLSIGYVLLSVLLLIIITS